MWGPAGRLFDNGAKTFSEPTREDAWKRIASFGLEVGMRPPSEISIRQAPLFPDGFNTPADTLSDYVRYKLQDKYIDLKRVEQAIPAVGVRPIDDAADAYLAEELYHGRAEDRIRRFREETLEPLLKEIKAAGLTIDQLDYLPLRPPRA